MKTIDMTELHVPLDEYLRHMTDDPEILAEGENPLALLIPIKHANLEEVARIHLQFLAFIQRMLEQQEPTEKKWHSELPKDSVPLYCSNGKCYIGYYTQRETDKRKSWLYRPDGSILRGRAILACACGAGREWHEAPKSLKQ